MYLRCTLVVCALAMTAALAQEVERGVVPARAELPSKRMFGLVPNYKTVDDRDVKVPPMSARDKWRLAMLDSFDPMSFAVAGLYAGFGHAANQYPSYGQGAQGFGKRYGAAVGEQVVGKYMSEAILPVLLHMDPRYYRMARGTGWTRTRWAISRTFVAPTDAGRMTVNYPSLVGKAATIAVTSVYIPAPDRTVKVGAQRYASQMAGDVGFNLLKEFWPDLQRRFFSRGTRK